MSTLPQGIIASNQGVKSMKKIPVSILLWRKYSDNLERIVDKVKRFYKMDITETNMIGCGEIKGFIYEKDISNIEKFHSVIGVFPDSKHPKKAPLTMEEVELPLLSGKLVTEVDEESTP